MEKNLKPNENLSLRQFIKETENVSECDVIQVSDDDLEDLPRDNVPVKAKVMSCTAAVLIGRFFGLKNIISLPRAKAIFALGQN